MSIFKSIIIAALFSAGTVALAADDEAALEKPSLFTSQTIKVNAVVEAINHETRVVTLRKADGEITLLVPVEDEIHEMDNHSDRPAVEIHVYGADLRSLDRSAYDLETGKITTFRTKRWDNC